MKSILLLVLVPFLSLNAQDELIKKLFPGKWKMDFDKASIYEEWVLENETELIGTSFSLDTEKKIISEIIYLKKFGDQWAYIALPRNQDITLFKLVEYSSDKFVFENIEHDFPQRIIYEFLTGGKLNASIEENINGKFTRKEFPYLLIKE